MSFPLVHTLEKPVVCPKCGQEVEHAETYRCKNEDCSWWVKHEDWSPEMQIELMGIHLRGLREDIDDS